MRILYLGDNFTHSTSAHRAAALRRLGHETICFNPQNFVPRYRIVSSLNVRTGYRLFANWVDIRLRRKIAKELSRGHQEQVDLVWMDGCPQLPVPFYRWVKTQGLRIVNYNVDDPFGRRDRRKWDLYLAAVPYHDLTVVVREENIEEAKARGARRVRRVYRSYDPVAHAPQDISASERKHWAGEVVFVGSWMPERGPFIMRLLEAGVPLSIWGDHWHKAAEYESLRPTLRGPAVYGNEYVKAIQCAKVALGLLSKGNRDLHTQRSAEVPYISGAAFCAERTREHEIMLKDGVEAVFWSSTEECIAISKELLQNPDRRCAMAAAARQRILSDSLSNDAVMEGCLAAISRENEFS